MANKPAIRWDWIETQWQRGNLSNYQIAKLHQEEFGRKIDESSIRQRVSQYGWQRDISEAIRRETRTKLAEGVIRKNPQRQESAEDAELRAEIEAAEIAVVDRASDALVEIEKSQRLFLARSGVLAERMELYALAQLTVDSDGTPNQVYEPGELKDLIAAASQAVYTRVRIINTERRVYGMDAPGWGVPGVDSETGAYSAQVHVYIPDNGRDKPKT
jgi:hypothetical protein